MCRSLRHDVKSLREFRTASDAQGLGTRLGHSVIPGDLFTAISCNNGEINRYAYMSSINRENE